MLCIAVYFSLPLIRSDFMSSILSIVCPNSSNERDDSFVMISLPSVMCGLNLRFSIWNPNSANLFVRSSYSFVNCLLLLTPAHQMSPPLRLKRSIQPIFILNGLNLTAFIADFASAVCFLSHSPKKTSVKWRLSGALKRPLVELFRNSSRSETNLDRVFGLKLIAINSRILEFLSSRMQISFSLFWLWQITGIDSHILTNIFENYV